jgi:hypothetical protein
MTGMARGELDAPEWNRDTPRKASPMDDAIQELIRMTDEMNQVMGALRQKLDPIISPQMEDRVGVAKDPNPGPTKSTSYHVNRIKGATDDLRKAKHLGMVMLEELEV